MQVRVIDGRFPTSAAFNEMAERRAGETLGRFADRITELQIRIADDNGPRGSHDKRCSIYAVAAGLPPSHVETIADDFHAAFNAAMTKIKHLLTHKVERRKVKRRPL